MRITDHILNDTSQRSGLALGGSTLVNQLNGNSSDSLINSLGNKGSSTLKGISEEKYNKMKESAKKLGKYADRLLETGKDSVFEKAKENNDSSEICEAVKGLADSYNELMSRLRTDTSTMGMFYRQSLLEAVSENTEAFAEVGVTADKKGNLKMDEEKLKSSDIDKLEKLFGSSGILTAKLSLIAEKIADNAEANLKSASNQYDANGSSVDVLLRSFDSKS